MLLIALICLVGIGIGFVVALLSGTSAADIGHRLRTVRLNHWPVLALGIVLTLAIGLDTNMLAGRFALGISLALLLAWCFLNRHITGVSIVAIGIAANLAVLLLNGYMPVDPSAVVAAGIIDFDGLDRVLLGTTRRWANDATIAEWLGSVVPLAPIRDVITLGDLVIAAGLANIGFRLMWPASLGTHRLKKAQQADQNDGHEESVVLWPTTTSTTQENPLLVSSGVRDKTNEAPTDEAVPAATPTGVHSGPAWVSRVEPAPWPAPTPWLSNPTDAPANRPAEPTNTHR